MNWIRIASINIFVFLALIVILELCWSFFEITLSRKTTCRPAWVQYAYCPNIKVTKVNFVSDGGRVIEIQVDELGGRVKPGAVSTLRKAHNLVIGDSFIQAEEISYDETIYGRWNKMVENSTYALGYSSWNPIQYLDAIQRINKKDSHYYVFLMTNDVTPNYARSVSGEIKNQAYYNQRFLGFLRERLFYITLSRIKRKILQFSNPVESNVASKPQMISSDDFSIQKIHDCSALIDKIDTDYSTKLGFDYLVYSKSFDCWPETHKKAFDEFVAKTKDIHNYVVNILASKITFVMVGAGWNFADQNSIGRQTSDYGFAPNISVTQQGIVREFRKNFPGLEIIDAETLIAADLAKCSKNCVDKYFLPVDGHWTSYTHGLILSNIQN